MPRGLTVTTRRSLTAMFLACLLIASHSSSAADQKSQPKQKAQKITDLSRMTIIRSLNAEAVFIRRAFPMGPKGLTIKDGQVSPNESQIQQLIAGYGPAVKPGDRARITNVEFRGGNRIIFEINGGPKRKLKWYERIQVSGLGGSAGPLDPNDPTLNARGSVVTLEFDKYVPELTVDQVKELLNPVFDFHSKSAVEAYLETVPPKVKEAIKNHQALVGMNREMVTYAKGRAPRKIREKERDVEYEEWIYGEPPQDVEFVRFVGDEVVRIATMKIDGEKIVRTTKEVELEKPAVAAQQQPGASQPGGGTGQAQPAPDQPTLSPGKAPTLRRPGEPAPEHAPASTRAPLPQGRVPQDPSQGPAGAPAPPPGYPDPTQKPPP